VKNIAILLSLCTFLCVNAQDINVQKFRKLLYDSHKNEKIARQFHSETRHIGKTHPPILQGFKGMSEFMLCAHLNLPWEQLSLFYKGKNQLEEAIKTDPNNAELRYFRFITQTNIPSILGYSDHIVQDKLVLIAYLKNQSKQINKDEDLFKRIKDYLLQCSQCGELEKKLIRNL